MTILSAGLNLFILRDIVFDGPESKKAFEKQPKYAKQMMGRLHLLYPIHFEVARHIVSFEQLIGPKVDILFCNEEELKMLHGLGVPSLSSL